MRNPLLTNGKRDDIITFVVSRILGCTPRLPLLPTFHQKDSASVCRCHAPLSLRAPARGRQQAAAGLRPAEEAGEKAGSNGTHGIFFQAGHCDRLFFMPIPRSVSAPDSALTRRRVGVDCSMASCRPARRWCLPVLAPAQAFVRAGNGGDNSECGMRNAESGRE